MKYILITLCFALVTACVHGQGSDTFEVHFPFNVSKLSKESVGYIDKLISSKALVQGDKFIVLGYADYVGGNSYNDTLSMLRAKSVRDYLMHTGFEEDHIKLCVGKGEIERNVGSKKNGYAADRKVQIIIDRAAMVPPPPVEEEDNSEFGRLEVNQTYSLNNIFFKMNSPILVETSQPDLEKLLEFLSRRKRVRVRIEGHVCCMGPQEGMDSRYKGGNLSELRAKAVAHYLITKGIDSLRLESVGLGNRNPVVRNEKTQDDKQRNRRVEVRILSK